MPAKLTNLTICGFKTIRELRDFQLRPMNVLIGANGAGKSNFLSFFRLLNRMLASPSDLQNYVAVSGGAHALLHSGLETAREVEASVTVEAPEEEIEYRFALGQAAADTLVFAHEGLGSRRTKGLYGEEQSEFGTGNREAQLVDLADMGDPRPTAVCSFFRRFVVHQFHNTSQTARIRQKWRMADNRSLKEDAGNLAPVLHRLHEDAPAYYRRIIETLRLVIPCFADFDLREDHGSMLLQWRERGSDMLFDVSQASDGSLRTMALVTLLKQPEADLPAILILDEPELGLHPYAIDIIAGLLRAASNHTQVIVATQSAAFVNCFDPEDVVVVNRTGMESTFERQSTDHLHEWLDDYSLAELWEKNVIGGRPGG